jgi:hypothetical protein
MLPSTPIRMSIVRRRQASLTVAAWTALVFGLFASLSVAAQPRPAIGKRLAGDKAKQVNNAARRASTQATVRQLPQHPAGLPHYLVRPSPGNALEDRHRPQRQYAGPKEYPQPVTEQRSMRRLPRQTALAGTPSNKHITSTPATDAKPLPTRGVWAQNPKPQLTNRLPGTRMLSSQQSAANAASRLPRNALPVRARIPRPGGDNGKLPVTPTGGNLRPLDQQHGGDRPNESPQDVPTEFYENETVNDEADDRDLSDMDFESYIHLHPDWPAFSESWQSRYNRRRFLFQETLRMKHAGIRSSNTRFQTLADELADLDRDLGPSAEAAFKVVLALQESLKKQAIADTIRPSLIPIAPGAESPWSQYDQYGADSRFGNGQRQTTAGGAVTIYDPNQSGFAAGAGNNQRGAGGNQGSVGGGNNSDQGTGGGGQLAGYGGRDPHIGSVDQRNYGGAIGANAGHQANTPEDDDDDESDPPDDGGGGGGGGDDSPESGPADGQYRVGPIEWNRNNNQGATVGTFLPDGDPAKGGGADSDVGPRIRRLPRYRPSGDQQALSPTKTESILPTTTGSADEEQVQVGDRRNAAPTQGTNDLEGDLRGRINDGAAGATVEGFISRLWWQVNSSRAQPPKMQQR